MKEKIRKIGLVLSILLVIGGVGVLVYYYSTRYKEEKEVDDLKQLIIEDSASNMNNPNLSLDLKYYIIDGNIVQEKFKDIYLKNQDFVGWIEIEDSKVDYPVMYTPKDPQYYLRRNFDKNYSIAGTIFVGEHTDLVRPTDNVIIYGHHMDDGSMFANILKYEDEEYYKKHKYIQFDTLTRNGTYEVIAAFRTEAHSIDEDYKGFNVYENINMPKYKFDEYVKNCLDRTPYKTVDTVDYDEKLITLSTCAYHNMNGRYVVVAKLVKEKTVNTDNPPIEVITTK